ncbi:MAG: HAD family phosphatase [Clostridiales bacterium]|nr:HAD family phosphatase [Clostridiales bacterium]
MAKCTKNIKLVALDLDGTLLNSEGKISLRTGDAIRRRSKNYIFSVKTGRMYCAGVPFVKMLGLNTYMGTHNGACVYDSATDKCVYSCSMQPGDVESVVLDCLKRGIYFQLVVNDEFYFREHCRYSDFYSSICLKPGNAVENIENRLREYNVTKIILMAPEGDIPAHYSYFKEKYSQELGVVTSRAQFIELTDKRADKKSSLEIIAARYGVGLNEIMAFGDQLNDLSMLEGAGVGIAMGNAHPELKKKADIVTLSNDEDGVAYMLERLL